MPKLPRIISPAPVDVSPPVSQYNDLALTVLVVRPHANGGVGTATMHFSPYDYETETVLEDPELEVKINASNFQDMLAANPALIPLVDALGAELGLMAQAKIVADNNPPEEPVFEEPTP
jgi:hypothetical protein